jgi:VIT1/CCC1 family predicted Fe2+/Mn2+ transporter
MTKLLEQALQQVERLSANEQDAAGAALIDYLAHRDEMRLSEAQLAEVRRRRADPNRTLVSHAQAKERLGRLPG